MPLESLKNGRLAEIIEILEAQIDGGRTKSDVRSLTAWSRTPGSSGYQAAARFTSAALRDAGVSDVTRVSCLMGAQADYRGWSTDPAWDVTRAVLRVVSPIERTLADWTQEPIAVHQGSWGTPPEGIEADLVDVGEGIDAGDYSDRDVRGCVVLSSGPVHSVYRQAVIQRGAAGVISHHMPWPHTEVGRTPEELPDLVSQAKVPAQLDDENRGFGFSISRQRAMELKELLLKGPVRVSCCIEGGPFEGSFELVTGRIPGTVASNKEFIITAHLCHPGPGANDNASGVALGIEIARSLRAVVERFGPPRYSIRFLFVPEIIGGLAFVASDSVVTEDLLGGVNLDMVGASQAITKSPILFENTPWSLPTYLFDLGVALLSKKKGNEQDATWRFRPVPFEGGSDNIVYNDGTVGAPMVGFGYRADPCYHSNLDVWTNMDEDVLERVGLAAGSQAVAAAWMDAGLADEVLRIVSGARQARDGSLPRAVEEAMIESISYRAPADPEIDHVIQKHLRRLRAEPGVERPTQDVLASVGLPSGRPVRGIQTLVWPPVNGVSRFYRDLPSESGLLRRLTGYGYVSTCRRVYEMLNLCDGTRTWPDIFAMVSGQFDGTCVEDFAELAGCLLSSGAIEQNGGVAQ